MQKIQKNTKLQFKNLFKIILFLISFILISFIFIIIYIYHSGGCYIKNKKYNCSNTFCYIKEVKYSLPYEYKNNLLKLSSNKDNYKRVIIKPPFGIEKIYTCSIPSKAGSTISTQKLLKLYPDIIKLYQTTLCDFVSKNIGIKLYPTELKFPTSCSILIYENENDWINWHYDYNYYNGRFFTVLIPLTTDSTCTFFQYILNDKINKIDIKDKMVIFEGDFLYHNASKLCKNQKRCILALQYVTSNEMNFINKLRIKIKDIAYIGF